ncbi:hypothetical protein [Nonomuraea sp. NPDC002799]
MALDTKLYLELVANYTGTSDLTTPSAPIAVRRQVNLTSGVGAGQADLIWADTRTVAPSATDSLDLAASLSGLLGGTVTFARIKGLIVAAAATNTNNVLVQRPATNGVPLFSAVSANIPLKPGGVFTWFDPSAAGVVVTPTSGDLIDFVNSGAGTSVTYDVVVIGALS